MIDNKIIKAIIILPLLFGLWSAPTYSQTIAKEWNEVLLDAIRGDYARPTVHARNLFHVSVLMYDSWAVLSERDDTYFLGKTNNGFECEFNGIAAPDDIDEARSEIMSYAIYRLLRHRFMESPSIAETFFYMDLFMDEHGYDIAFTDEDYSTGSYAALGNYMGQKMIEYGMLDGANEMNDYENEYYEPINEPLVTEDDGNPTLTDPNHWQPLTLDVFIDQGGNPIPINTPDFLSPEWGNVWGFALTEADRTTYERAGNEYHVFHDPGPPPYLNDSVTDQYYKWGFEMVTVWQSHLDPNDGILWDISPASKGGIALEELPEAWSEYEDFYDFFDGGTFLGDGYTVNPRTGQPYSPQIVPRGDFGRVLAEFWADGPDSETPPGHWFTILNYVNEHPELIKKLKGEGQILSDLEWDIKSYFILGGAMHDAAIASWSIKGWYDYIRPISAIRYMGDMGQCTSDTLPNYHPNGLPLIEGYVELVMPGDELVGDEDENLYKMKLYTWRGHDYIDSVEIDMAGVGWILSEDWWPYQRPSFVTPPFAGYISGHSTYSRAAADVLTMLTGDPYFPGGIGEFNAEKNEFLVFEEGPSIDLVLQWATYTDASDECSLSRIWGGIHPPADDIAGRKIGRVIGINAFEMAETYFGDLSTAEVPFQFDQTIVYPNPVVGGKNLQISLSEEMGEYSLEIINTMGQVVFRARDEIGKIVIDATDLPSGQYFVNVESNNNKYSTTFIVQDSE